MEDLERVGALRGKQRGGLMLINGACHSGDISSNPKHAMRNWIADVAFD